MLSETEKLRRKVFWARLACAVVLLAGLAFFFYSQWQGSDSGVVSNAEFRLKRDHTRSTILDCLDISERLLRKGNTNDSKKIESAVDVAMDVQSMKPAEAGKAYLDIAHDLQKRGSVIGASHFAAKGLGKLNEAAQKSGTNQPNFSESIEEAANIIEGSGKDAQLSADAIKSIEQLCAAQSKILADGNSDRMLRWLISHAAGTNETVSDDLIKCMFARNVILANKGLASELDKGLQGTSAAIARNENASAAKIPTILPHLIDLAAALQVKAPELSRTFALKAADEITKVDQTTLDDAQQALLADSYRRLSDIYLALNDASNATTNAKMAASLRPLKDEVGVACANQLVKVLLASGQAKEAEALGLTTYKTVCTATDFPKDAQNAMRAASAEQLFQIYRKLKKSLLATRLMSDEIRYQQKNLPSSATQLAGLLSSLANYQIANSNFRLAQQSVRQLADLARSQKGDTRLQLDMQVIELAVKAKNPDLSKEASTDAISIVSKDKDKLLDPQWIDDFCSAMENFRKAEDNEHYAQAMDLVKSGFNQQLGSANPDPIILASVVNQLGTSGEERTADQLRTDALSKLKDPVASVFRSRSMDFVVNGDKDNPQYTDPEQSIDVYLDLAASMRNKDNESSFRYAFEAMKVAYLLAAREPSLLAVFMDRIDEAAKIMLATKQAPNKDQVELVYDLAALETENIKRTSKDAIIDLMLSALSKSDLDITATNSDGASNKIDPDVIVRSMILKNEMLAKRGLVGQLDAQSSRTKELFTKLGKPQVDLADHYCDLSESLSAHHDSVAARRYAASAARTLEDAAAPAALSLEKKSAIDSSTMALTYSRIATVYKDCGDLPSSLIYARKAYSSRSLQDTNQAWRGITLVDRLLEANSFAEAESLATNLYGFAKARTPNIEVLNLRTASARRLYRALNEQHKDEQAVAILKEELDERQKMQAASSSTVAGKPPVPGTNTPPLQTAELNSDLASYYLKHQNTTDAAACLEQIQLAKSQMRPDQRATWDRSSRQRELIYQAVSLDNAKVASEAVADLVRFRDTDKSTALKTPPGWWSSAISYFAKNGDATAQKRVVDYVRAGVTQQLGRAGSDPIFLGEIVSQLNSFGEQKVAIALRNEAERRLTPSAKDLFLAQCKDLPSSFTADSDSSKDNSTTTDSAKTNAASTPPPDTSGRIDTSD